MPLLDPSKVLFIGLGQERVCWYRIALPAMFMGADWVGLAGEPPNVGMATGYVKGATVFPNFDDYDVLVIQQPRGRGWFDFINHHRDRGAKVVFEIDDYLHGIQNVPDHDYRHIFNKKELPKWELCMRACDAMICSTDYIARRYSTFNNRTHVCINGLDMGRYKITRPPRGDLNGKPAVMLGWSGATGHARAAVPWLNQVLAVMREYDNTCFVSIGQNWAAEFAKEFEGRAISIPFTLIEQYPAAMALFDIAIAPAGKSSWHKGKSQLRFYEAAAIGLPVIADSHYDEIEDEESGMVVESHEEVGDCLRDLIEDRDLRWKLGSNALKYVYENRSMATQVIQWREALERIVA